jgi:hypothetical protein
MLERKFWVSWMPESVETHHLPSHAFDLISLTIAAFSET